MIEGIHAFNPVIMGDLEKHATSVYLSVASVLLTDHNIRGLSRTCCASCAAPCATACSAARRWSTP